MRTTSKLVAVLALLYAGFLVSLAITASRLPANVATHFNLQGQPNGWMNRSTHLASMTALGVLLPLVIVGIFAAIRWLPVSMINLPRREYWLAPPRRESTQAYLMQLALWLACGMVLFIGGLNYLVVQANERQPAQLANGPMLLLLGAFMLGILLWIVALVWHFGRQPKDGAHT